jgi:hypothetical protein
MGITDPKAAVGGGRWMPFKNTSDETIPAYAVVKFNGTQLINGAIVWKMVKPDAEATVGNVAFNGPTEVAQFGFGACTYDVPCRVLYSDGSDDDLAVGDDVGPEENEWHMKKGNSGFVVLGGIDTGAGYCLIGKEGGGGGEGVAFEIESMSEYPGFTGLHYAICDILARDNPKTVSSGEEEGTRKITVHDLLGCFFEEDAADLVGRKGFARYMKVEGEANPKWIVHSLCCPPE